MLSEAQLRENFNELMALRGVKLSPEEENQAVRDFIAIASSMNLRKADEIFGFMMIIEAMRILSREELLDLEERILDMHMDAMESAKSDILGDVTSAITKTTSQMIHTTQESWTRRVIIHVDEANKPVRKLLDNAEKNLSAVWNSQQEVKQILTDQDAKLNKVSESLSKMIEQTTMNLSVRNIATLACGGLVCFCLGFIVCMLIK